VPRIEPDPERLLRARIARRLVVLGAAGALEGKRPLPLAPLMVESHCYLRFLSELVRSAASLGHLFQKIVPQALPDPGRLYQRQEFLTPNGPRGTVHWPLTIKHRLRSQAGSALETICLMGSRVLEAPENILLAVTLLESSERAALLAGRARTRPLCRDDRRVLARVRAESAKILVHRLLGPLTPSARATRNRGVAAIQTLEGEVARRLKGPRPTAPPWSADLLRLRRSLRGLAEDLGRVRMPVGPLYALACGLDTLGVLRDEVDLREVPKGQPALFRSNGDPYVEIVEATDPQDALAHGLCWLLRRSDSEVVTGLQAV
jgi:hypothetical protein